MSQSSPFNLKQRIVLVLGSSLMAWAMRLLASSWRVRVLAAPGTQPEEGGPWVYAMWHAALLSTTGHWRGHNIQGLASQSFDGEIISKAMEKLGYPPLSRGSSSRGGVAGLQGHLEALSVGRHVVVTMDGPRGPRHQAKAGTVVIAARSGRPLVPVLCAARPALRLRNWDQTLLPLPFAKVVFLLGEPIPITESAVEGVLAGMTERMDELERRAFESLDIR